MTRGDIFVISAPSGSGKTTICRALLARVEGLSLSVSCTTRERKPGEVDGVDRTFPAKPPRAYDPLHLTDRGFQVVVHDQVVVLPQFPDLAPGRREAPFDLLPAVPGPGGEPRPERLPVGRQDADPHRLGNRRLDGGASLDVDFEHGVQPVRHDRLDRGPRGAVPASVDRSGL